LSKTYFVYIVTNRPRGIFYIGFTDDLGERVSAHKSGGGSEFTKKYNLTQLVYCETFSNPKDAIDREKRLKRWKREWKIELIEKSNPNWAELQAF
jgi:putative endonuclease